jgi:hypothetical protein
MGAVQVLNFHVHAQHHYARSRKELHRKQQIVDVAEEQLKMVRKHNAQRYHDHRCVSVRCGIPLQVVEHMLLWD